jgi:RNA polymerase-binding protein DksA
LIHASTSRPEHRGIGPPSIPPGSARSQERSPHSIAIAAYPPLIAITDPACRGRAYDRDVADSPDSRADVDPRVALLAEREQVLAELAGIEVEGPGQMTYGSQAAAATHVFEQQRDLALRERNEQHLAAIDAALARVDAGTYGTCVSCGKPIAPERLEALPSAALCIDCQRQARRR